MATDVAAPTPAPETSGPAEHAQPTVDVAALRAFLDGEHAEVRDMVRASLAEHASVLEDAEQLTTAEYRERVKELVVAMAEAGQTGLGFPEQYGGGGEAWCSPTSTAMARRAVPTPGSTTARTTPGARYCAARARVSPPARTSWAGTSWVMSITATSGSYRRSASSVSGPVVAVATTSCP